jgi:uncharacterized RDD family membrane protein YckC
LKSPIDTVVTAETPEGIAIPMRPSGFPVRAAAYLIDAAIRLAVLSALGTALGAGGHVGTGLLLISLFAVNWLYPVVFELLPAAATPGKAVMGLQVMMADGLPLTPAGCLTRNLMRVVDAMPAMYAIAIISMLLRKDARRLGDLAGGTLVVYRNKLEPSAALGEGTPEPPPFELSARQQAAIAAFAWRVPRLTPERAEEIAQIAAAAAPHGADSASVTSRLIGVARWQIGQRRKPANAAASS